VTDEPLEDASPISVLIADDQALVRAGLRAIIETDATLRVVGEAGDGATAIAEAQRLRPRVVLMDIQMPRVDGIAATTRILADAREAAPAVLVLTTFDLDEYVYDALRAGASGFLLKDAPPEQILDAVHVVAAGDALIAPAITRRLIEYFARSAPARGTPSRLRDLTPRETHVLSLAARGLSNAEIASELVLSEAPTKTHIKHILSKLHARDRVQAVVIAYDCGLVAPQDSGGMSSEATPRHPRAAPR
jgi:DNA-binding NarL/FixJ family response regulator